MDMEIKDSEDIMRFTTTLEMKIPHFSTNAGIMSIKSEPIQERYSINKMKVVFRASLYLFSNNLNFNLHEGNGNGEKSENWLKILPSVNGANYRFKPSQDHGSLSCTVSVIDIEGTSRNPKVFVWNLSDGDVSHFRYEKRSYILDRADEFLTEGELTLRYDFSFEFCPGYSKMPFRLGDFSSKIPISAGFSDRAEIKHTRDMFQVFDFTGRILTLPQFHEARRRFGVYGIPPVPQLCTLELDEDILESVWMFDTENERYLLSLDERQDSVGSRLLKASPVIRGTVNSPMEEQHEKRIAFPSHIDRATFGLVLYFLEKETFPACVTYDFKMVYRFSHFYMMEEMKRKCAEELINSSTDFEMLEEFANFYSDDEHLSKLLKSRRQEYEQHNLNPDDTPYSDCYI